MYLKSLGFRRSYFARPGTKNSSSPCPDWDGPGDSLCRPKLLLFKEKKAAREEPNQKEIHQTKESSKHSSFPKRT